MSAPLTPRTLVIPLRGHEEIVAALHLCAMLNNDNRAVVMLKGYGDDWENFTGIYLDDYDADALSDPDWFADYGEPQIWVTVYEAGTQ